MALHEHIRLGAKIPAGLVVVQTAIADVGEHRTVAVTVASHELNGAEKC